MNRLIFANQLRGIAALSVAGSHLVGAYWAMRDFMAGATATPVQGGPVPAIFGLFSHTYLNFGPLGVGVFFLISGLVIPLSLEHHTRASFLLARLLRIYPTYLAALAIEMAVLHASAAYWGRPFPYGNWAIISNALLIYNTLGQPGVDLVNWTLCIELKFYLLVMLLAPQIRRGSVSTVLGLGVAIVLANLVMAWPALATRIGHPVLTQALSMESVYLVFMLIGVLFNFHLRGLLRWPAFIGSAAGLLALFLWFWPRCALASQFPVVTVNYIYALALFALLYSARRWARPNRILDFLAGISYPFYLVHSLLGLSVLKLLILGCGLPYLLALPLALGTGIAVATILHVTIETRTIRAGRALSRRGRGVPAVRRLATR